MLGVGAVEVIERGPGVSPAIPEQDPAGLRQGWLQGWEPRGCSSGPPWPPALLFSVVSSASAYSPCLAPSALPVRGESMAVSSLWFDVAFGCEDSQL